MPDSFTKVTRVGWGSRIMGSIKSVLFGIVLFFVSFAVLWWNEGRAVKTAKGLEEGAAQVISLSDPSSVDPSNNQKLVHMSGMVMTSDTLHDTEFGVSENAIHLKRLVEMYQWQEKKESKTEKKIGGSEETVTTYTYYKDWSRDQISSGNFGEPTGHQNPGAFPYNQQQLTASSVTIGGYQLPPFLISSVSDYQSLPIVELPSPGLDNAKYSSGMVYLGRGTITQPEIGDVRVGFEVVRPAQYSLIAKQVGNTFEEFNTSTGTTISMIEPGIKSADNMFQAAQERNTMLTWILRFVGFFLMFIGLRTIFAPLVVVADVLPFLGNILSMGVGLFGGVVAFVLSLITIAIAWIFYRPLLGIGLLVAAIAVFVFIYSRGRKKKLATQRVEQQV